MEMSPSISNISAAYVALQQKLEPLSLDKEVKVTTTKGGNYSFWYATFGQAIDKTKKLLQEHGLAIPQFIEPDGSVTTMLLHSSGEWFSSNLLISGDKTPQGIGSAISYAKRYSYCAILGIVGEDDDDGNIAQGNKFETGSRKPKTATPQPMSAEVFQSWVDVVNGFTTLHEMAAYYEKNKSTIEPMPNIKALFTKRKADFEKQPANA